MAVKLLHSIRPALEEGFIGLASTQFCFCDKCFEKNVDEKGVLRKFSNAQDALYARYLDETTVTAKRSEIIRGGYDFKIEGPDDLIEHGSLWGLAPSIPRDIRAKLKKRKSYQLSRHETEDLGVIKRFATAIVDDISIQNLYSLNGFRYLTDREIDLLVLATVNDEQTQATSDAMLNGLEHVVPALPDVPLKRLVQLRKHEGESFRVYRDALNKVLGELKGDNKITAKSVREAVSDSIAPQINKIENAIKNNRRLIWRSLINDAVIGSGFVTVGLFSGLLPPNVGTILAGLGGYKFAAGVADKDSQLFQESKDLREEDFYFLWKVSRKGSPTAQLPAKSKRGGRSSKNPR